jgi:hypothetical protein
MVLCGQKLYMTFSIHPTISGLALPPFLIPNSAYILVIKHAGGQANKLDFPIISPFYVSAQRIHKNEPSLDNEVMS